MPGRREETVSERVERTVSHAMSERRSISWSAEDTQKERSVPRYGNWLKEHISCCDALKEAVNQDFNINNDEFITQTLLDAWKDLQQSKDPAVRYLMSTLTDLPKGSQPRNPDAAPNVQWSNKDQIAGAVLTPAGTYLGFIEKYADGRWGIDPSQDGPHGTPRIAKALADAKAYLVNRLTREVTVTVNEDTRQLLIVRDEDFFPLQAWIPKTALSQTYLEFWDANHGLRPGEQTSRDGIERKRRLCTSTRRQDRKSRRANGLD